MNKREVLTLTTFGQRIAEDEADDLERYFVETDQWRKVLSGGVDVVYGPKGSGKSALYSLLRKKQDGLFLDRGIILVAGENVRGTPVFAELVAHPPTSEEQFRGLWKLYFLSLIGYAFKSVKLDNKPALQLIASMEEAGLLLPSWSPRRMLRAALEYAKRIELAAEVKLNPITGQPEAITPKIMLREPGTEERDHGFISVDTLLEMADQALGEDGKKFWIVLDRLDVAFVDSSELEANALRALFRVYRDMASLSNFGVKIFLRDDIWARITAAGFREASHVTRSITITWTAPALLHLVIRRALHNEAVRNYYKVDPALVLGSVQEQEKLFYRMFPDQVDPGKRKSTTFDWLLSRTTDGTKQPAPRELIHLLAAIRDQQLKSLEMGTPEPPNEALFDRAAIKAALPEVSKVRYEQTLLAEHPGLKPLLSPLEGKKTQQTPNTLAKIWGVSREVATSNAERLTEVGFFEKRGTREQPLFWVPFIYRDALKMPQGSEE